MTIAEPATITITRAAIRPLLSIDAAKAILNKDEDAILALIEEGRRRGLSTCVLRGRIVPSSGSTVNPSCSCCRRSGLGPHRPRAKRT
jgi:hypothetical protein